LSKALEKYTDMIKSNPGDAELFIVRGLIRSAQFNAIQHDDIDLFYHSLVEDADFDEARRLDPNNRYEKEKRERARR
jgi:hypothetical protein